MIGAIFSVDAFLSMVGGNSQDLVPCGVDYLVPGRVETFVGDSTRGNFASSAGL